MFLIALRSKFHICIYSYILHSKSTIQMSLYYVPTFITLNKTPIFFALLASISVVPLPMTQRRAPTIPFRRRSKDELRRGYFFKRVKRESLHVNNMQASKVRQAQVLRSAEVPSYRKQVLCHLNTGLTMPFYKF